MLECQNYIFLPDLRDDSRTGEWSYHSEQLADKSLRYVQLESAININFRSHASLDLFYFIIKLSDLENYHIISPACLDQV